MPAACPCSPPRDSNFALNSPQERISQRNLVPSACLAALKDVAQAARDAGIDVAGPLIEAGAISRRRDCYFENTTLFYPC